jgi:DNA-binding Xre family transcriptional regulator
MAIHIGSIIKEVLAERGMSKVELSRRLNMTSTNIHKIFKRETIDTGLLLNLCKALKYDFFQYYMSASTSLLKEGDSIYGQAETAVTSDQTGPIKNPTQEEDQIVSLKLEMARKEISYLKKINDLLENKEGSDNK